jgi:hypothetical protein
MDAFIYAPTAEADASAWIPVWAGAASSMDISLYLATVQGIREVSRPERTIEKIPVPGSDSFIVMEWDQNDELVEITVFVPDESIDQT